MHKHTHECENFCGKSKSGDSIGEAQQLSVPGMQYLRTHVHSFLHRITIATITVNLYFQVRRRRLSFQKVGMNFRVW